MEKRLLISFLFINLVPIKLTMELVNGSMECSKIDSCNDPQEMDFFLRMSRDSFF